MSFFLESPILPGSEIAGHLVLATAHRTPTRWVLRARDARGRADEVAITIEAGDEADVVVARRHAQRLAAVGHQAVASPIDIQLTEFGVATIRPWFEVLACDVAASATWTGRRGIEVVGQIADALAAVHAAALSHGAVSASNIAIDARDRAVLLDAAPGAGSASDDTVDLGILAMGWLAGVRHGPVADCAVEVCRAAAAGQLEAAELADRLQAILLAADAPPVSVAVADDPTDPDDHERPRSTLIGVSIGAIALTLACASLAWASSAVGTSAPSARPPASEPVPCPGTDPAAVPGAEVLVADLDGAGCGIPILWRPARAEATITAGATAGRYRLGRRGDQLLAGDWDGDGAAEPALYRPTTGEVFSWPGWPDDGFAASTSRRDSGRVGGEARVVVDGDRQAVDVVGGTPG